jgi:hypothetical protein
LGNGEARADSEAVLVLLSLLVHGAQYHDSMSCVDQLLVSDAMKRLQMFLATTIEA